MNARRTLVTGGAGFIGSHVAEGYLARGDEVWIVDDLSSGRRENLPPGARFIQLDICDAALADVFREAGGFEVVNHHAAQIDVRRSVSDPRRDARVNLDGILNVLECAHRHGTSRVLFASSGGVVYGDTASRPTPEASNKLPVSPYGVAKLASEHYLYCYRKVHGLEYVALRYANVYGPRQDPHGEAGVIAIFSTRLAVGEPVTIFGDGEQTRDYVFVGDVVSANLLLTDRASQESAGLDARAFNVGTGQETSVNDLARSLSAVSGHGSEPRRAEARPGELQRSCLDSARLRALGWAPRTSLAEGLALTHEFISTHRWQG